MRVTSIVRIVALLSAYAPSTAWAHTGFENVRGFMHGFSHPFSGVDHILVMLLVGIFSYRLGGRALWMVPTSFVVLMGAGGIIGAAGITMPFLETGIALSVVVLGTSVLFDLKGPAPAAIAFVSPFAIIHGNAHGMEMGANALSVAYPAGFMLATALLHVSGMGISSLNEKISRGCEGLFIRSIGGVAAVAGIGILTSVV
ncbi:HupE/UreJ family protein [Mesorhizobium sp.]|uniref:HupE/UreJ family protein n=1 Tax=Mesorhizobium sp. TaxID=1871066 RepID=UPI000FE957B4|nr:HupE/UreJ family protein [Mesorhizobium sp.]RWA57946.1 MAG: HupE/UreJ family protein [Mesorhizobium sp.]